jgi:antitoxin component YwqK of YwqJK toxin-antitoxin module
MIEFGQPEGYWEWFRIDGTMKRSGYFSKGKQVGKWITYDESGQPYTETIKS